MPHIIPQLRMTVLRRHYPQVAIEVEAIEGLYFFRQMKFETMPAAPMPAIVTPIFSLPR